MTQKLTHEAQYKALCEKIEDLAPSVGFWVEGKPLDFTLEDFLKAWNIDWKIKTYDNDPYTAWERELSNIVIRWDLTAPLSSQSPETISFLHKILCL